MASYQSSLVHIHSFWSSFTCLGRNSLRTPNIGNYFCNLKRSYVILPSYKLPRKDFHLVILVIHPKKVFRAKGLNFRHTLYPTNKSNRPFTPDTIVQGLLYLKASIKAMSVKVIEVPGVEADDVIGTLAARSVDAGYKMMF